MSNLENGSVHLLVVVLFPSVFPRDSEESAAVILPLEPSVLPALDLLHQPLLQSPTSRIGHLDPGKNHQSAWTPDYRVISLMIWIVKFSSARRSLQDDVYFHFQQLKISVGTYGKRLRPLPQRRLNAGSDLFLYLSSLPINFVALRVMNELAGEWFDAARLPSTNQELVGSGSPPTTEVF